MIARHIPIVLVAAAACGEARGMVDASTATSPPRPEPCVRVEPGASIQAALDDVSTAAVCLAPGEHRGPLRLTRAVTLWGSRDAVLHSTAGTIIDVTAPHAAVLGLTIDGTGGRFDMLDGAVRLAANDTRVEGVTVTNAVFGILVERASRVRVVGNRIAGSRDPATGLRGDTIRMWETRDSIVEDNTIEDGRDLVVWYSRDNRIANNRVFRARYGLHFMYSHGNTVHGNLLVDGVVGVFVMYSRGLHITDNVIANAAGAAGMAIGLKDSGNIYVTGNRLINDTIGVYVDSSPMQRGDRVEIAANVLRLNDSGLVFHSSAKDLAVTDNDFADNGTQVRVDGGGDATGALWTGNYFDDYAGYDLDGDGVGDVPYELRSLSNQLVARTPNLALFRGTPALALVDAATHLDPLYQPAAVLIDRSPRIEPRWPTGKVP
jgi:nitrous oxidase accessory protein